MTMFSELDAVEGLTYTQRATAKVRALLEFAEKNPGLTRLMTGEALVFEEGRVQQYMTHVISKAETSVRQTLKLAVVNREIAADTNVARCAEVYVSFVTGRWLRFSQSGFTKRPTEGWSFAEGASGHSPNSEAQDLPKISFNCWETRTKVVRIVSSFRRFAPT